MSGPRAPHSLRHEPQSTPLKFEEPARVSGDLLCGEAPAVSARTAGSISDGRWSRTAAKRASPVVRTHVPHVACLGR
jgi:hypothetical protein